MESKISTPEALRFRAKIKDWGLSHTTLEEVFMKVLTILSDFLKGFRLRVWQSE